MAASERRAEEFYLDAGGVEDGLLCPLKLAARLGGGTEDEVGVVPGVVSDRVSGGDYGASDIGPLFDELANQEKRRFDLMAVEDFQQALGVRIVGAVVEGKSKLTRAGWQADEGSPADL